MLAIPCDPECNPSYCICSYERCDRRADVFHMARRGYRSDQVYSPETSRAVSKLVFMSDGIHIGTPEAAQRFTKRNHGWD